jgi:hypothetical protein
LPPPAVRSGLGGARFTEEETRDVVLVAIAGTGIGTSGSS